MDPARGIVTFLHYYGQRKGGMLSSAYHFGPFECVPGARVIRHRGRTISVGGRAFDLLVVLLEARGKLVSKQDLFKYVWPATVVEESSLRFQIATLRKALGSEHRDVIKTIPGRGYLIAVEVSGSRLLTDGKTNAIVTLQGAVNGSRGQDAVPTVVVIDDDPGVREALECLLLSDGIRVKAFGSVHDFLQSDRDSTPACLVVDVWMPGQSGLDLQAEFNALGVRVPLIFISGHADVPMSVKAMKAGAFEFLVKPVAAHELLKAVHLALEASAPSTLVAEAKRW